MAEHGYTPLGKYDSARDDLLHWLCTFDWAEESFGNVDEYGAYVWKISNEAVDVFQNNGEFNSVFEQWHEQCPEVIDSADFRTELVGHFIVTTNSSGFVYVERFESQLARDVEFTIREQAWIDWDDQDDEEHESMTRIQEEHEYKFGDDRL
jgi:hypothetical protein